MRIVGDQRRWKVLERLRVRRQEEVLREQRDALRVAIVNAEMYGPRGMDTLDAVMGLS